MKNVMVLIDESKQTPKAVSEAIKAIDKERDKLYLLNVASSWDVMGDEKGAGRLALSQHQAFCEAEKCSVVAELIEASNIGEAVVKAISKYQISELLLRGSAVDYVVKNSPSFCKVNVVGAGTALP